MGTIDGIIYISASFAKTIVDSGKIELYTFNDGKLVKVHESTGTSNIRKYRPFIHSGYIIYQTNEGLFKYDPKKDECILIGNKVYGVARVVS